jgi:hypothetical protein
MDSRADFSQDRSFEYAAFALSRSAKKQAQKSAASKSLTSESFNRL